MGDNSFVKMPLIFAGRFSFAIGKIAIRGDFELEQEMLVRFLMFREGNCAALALCTCCNRLLYCVGGGGSGVNNANRPLD
jgi:hypothetical protein